MPTHPSRPRLLLAALCTAQFLVVFDITAVSVALPSVRGDLGLDAAHLHWVVSGYAVAFSGLLLLAGRLADLRGRRRAFMVGLSVFGAGSLLCGIAWSAPALLAARALQGVGAALLSPAALALVAQAFPEGTARTRALGVWGSAGALAASSGALLGGALVQVLGWRGIFLINPPIAVAGTAVVRVVVPTDRPGGDRALDAAGAALATAGLTLLVAGLSQAGAGGWRSPAACGLLMGGALLLAAFGAWEAHAADPLLPRTALSAPALIAANGVALTHGAMMLGTFLLLAVYMQDVLGLSAMVAGAGLLSVRATQTVFANLGARAAGTLGPRPLMIAGMVGMTGGLALLSHAPADGSYAADLLPGLLMLGMTIPLVFLTVSMATLEAAGDRHAGVTSGLVNTCQWLGGAIGIALASAMAAAREGAMARAGADPLAAVAGGVRAGLLACVAMGLVGTLLAMALPRAQSARPRTRARAHEQQAR